MTPLGLHEWFARSAREHPGRPALKVGAETFTYRELDALAGTLAAGILALHGGTAPARVGLTTTPQPLTYAGYLAALRLGAAVVPLNSAFPPARSAAIAHAAALDLTLSDDLLTRLRTAPPPHDAPPPAPVTPEDTAYLLFTSGSTGVPKGVPVTHRSIDAFLRYVIERYELGPGCRMAQNIGLAFDPSVFELFAAWGSGATLVVPPRQELAKPARFVSREGITHWFSVPSVITMAHLTGGLAPGSMPTLRWSLFGGEQLTTQQARAWRAAAPQSVLENLYGPTEVTIVCTQYRLPEHIADWPVTANGTLPIGPVYPHLDCLVLDEAGNPAETGELCVRGVQRFNGYLDPADNNGRFLTPTGHPTDPSGHHIPGDKDWYRTGDLVQTLDGGTLVHLGRIDQQVKIMGQRVEIGETEAVLRDQEGIEQAAVVALHGPDGQTRLEAAYTGTPVPPAQLRQALSTRLPRYMVPHRFTHRTTLPLNINGKLDRRALTTELTTGLTTEPTAGLTAEPADR
ncbi:AMP-binding protein [Streptomyces sp. tea 10]|nr:AMP-binding protein [Streptomyces sp. tea 10]